MLDLQRVETPFLDRLKSLSARYLHYYEYYVKWIDSGELRKIWFSGHESADHPNKGADDQYREGQPI